MEEVVEDAPADESQDGAETEGEDVQEAAEEGEGSQEDPEADSSESVNE